MRESLGRVSLSRTVFQAQVGQSVWDRDGSSKGASKVVMPTPCPITFRRSERYCRLHRVSLGPFRRRLWLRLLLNGTKQSAIRSFGSASHNLTPCSHCGIGSAAGWSSRGAADAAESSPLRLPHRGLADPRRCRRPLPRLPGLDAAEPECGRTRDSAAGSAASGERGKSFRVRKQVGKKGVETGVKAREGRAGQAPMIFPSSASRRRAWSGSWRRRFGWG